MELRHTLLLTVVGPLLAAATEEGLLRLTFLHEAYEYRTRMRALARQLGDDTVLVENEPSFAPLIAQLGEYFCGRRRTFDLPLDLRGSAFQLAVWRRLGHIPFGKLRSYQRIAKEIGRPQALRAVGQAVGKNPIAIVLPCHRVIGADGKLVGFGGGISLKAQLLRLEGHTLGPSPRIIAPRLF
jgi:O-6-methylguanine DNA methyltransferase